MIHTDENSFKSNVVDRLARLETSMRGLEKSIDSQHRFLVDKFKLLEGYRNSHDQEHRRYLFAVIAALTTAIYGVWIG